MMKICELVVIFRILLSIGGCSLRFDFKYKVIISLGNDGLLWPALDLVLDYPCSVKTVCLNSNKPQILC